MLLLQGKLGKPIIFSSRKIGITFLSEYMKTMFIESGIDIWHRNIRNILVRWLYVHVYMASSLTIKLLSHGAVIDV